VVVVWRQLAPLVGVGVMNQAAVSRINGNRAPRYLWHRHETGQRFMLLRTNHGRRRGRGRVDSGRVQYRARFKAINDQDEGGNGPQQDRAALAFHDSACFP
jgi:hypothetical protein